MRKPKLAFISVESAESSTKPSTVGDVMKRRSAESLHNFTVTSASLKQSTGKMESNESEAVERGCAISGFYSPIARLRQRIAILSARFIVSISD